MTEGGDAPPAEEEDLDLDAALHALDLDMNCLESTSFTVDDTTGDAGAAQPPLLQKETTTTNDAEPKEEEEEEEPAVPEEDWKDRSEIYSRHFRPAPREREQLEQIASLLSVKSGLLNAPTRTSGAGGGGNFLDNLLGSGNDSNAALEEEDDGDQSPQAQWDRLVSGKGTAQTQNLPISIVLKHGKGVMYKDTDIDETTGMSGTVTRHGCDLILLTRGFMIAQRELKSSGGLMGGLNSLFGGGKKEKQQPKEEVLQILGSALWTQVCQIQHIAMKSSLLLTCGVAGAPVKDQVQFEIVVPSSDLEQWLSAMQTAATQAHLNFASSTKRDMHEERGWQYRLCHTPWFTEAVTGEVDDEDFGLEMTTAESAEEGLDQLDTYHGYAPLHYATRANHVDVMRHLLQAGANPNVADKEKKTPMYYAQRDELPTATLQLLEEFGAVKSQKAEDEMRGELFGKVADTEKAREYKRKEKEMEEEAKAKAAQLKAETAQSQMAQNLQAMQKRGEMIEELGDKATELQEGAKDYGDMAAQLKEKMKKKSVWGF